MNAQPKKKTRKKYVDKKRAKTYTLMRRGIDDPEYDETSESTHYMLYRSNDNAMAAESARKEREEYEADMANADLVRPTWERYDNIY